MNKINLHKKEKNSTIKYYVLSMIILLLIFFVAFATTDVLKNGFAFMSKNSKMEISIFADDFIPASMFEISGASEECKLDDDWQFETGEVIEKKVPTCDGYRFVNITADGVGASTLGVTKMPDGTTGYYYSTSEDEDDISLTILPSDKKFIINYAILEYNIDYKIVMDDGSKVPSYITNDSVFGIAHPTETVNQVYSFDVRVPSGYTAKVYRYWGENNERKEELTNGYKYPLGTDPIFIKENENIVVDEKNGPSSLLMTDTFDFENIKENQSIVVELTRKKAPVFDATMWLNTDNAGGKDDRGTTAKGPEVDPSNNNLYPRDSWNWGTLKTSSDEMEHDEETDSYKYVWTFQTNGGAGAAGYLFDSFEINGVGISIPFVPTEISPVIRKGGVYREFTEDADPENSTTITILPDGTNVKVEFVRVFDGGNSCNQRVYQITITNARTDMIVTGGNLMQYGSGGIEYSAYSIVGVYGSGNGNTTIGSYQYYDGTNWITKQSSSVNTVYSYPTNSSINGANIRFKLMDGYENPTYSFTDLKGNAINNQKSSEVSSNMNDLDNHAIYGPDKDGYYYIKLTNQGSERVALLYIEASPERYIVNYTSGSEVENPKNMPDYSGEIASLPNPQYDNNAGKYYDNFVNNIITIHNNVPIDPSGGYTFSHWILLDENDEEVENVRINPAHPVSLNNYYKNGVYDENLKAYILKLQAVWIKNPENFEFDISIKYTRNGEEHEELLKHVITKNVYDTSNSLTVLINRENSTILEWLLKHPTYALDTELNGTYIYEVENESTVYLNFKELNGGLYFSNEVIGDDEDNLFYFDIYNAEISDGSYLAFPKGISPEEANVEDIIEVIFKEGKASVTLNNKEGIVIYVPEGEYKVTEKANDIGKDYAITINGEESDRISTSINAGEIIDEVVFVNTLVKVEPPYTYDSIIKWTTICVLSIIGITLLILCYRKKRITN